jgi:4-amino-4-deoxy-L-arabinose transferase-like glycosyltransferase
LTTSEASTVDARGALRRIDVGAIFVLALVIRLLFLAEYARSPFFELSALDADIYHRLGWNFAEGSWPGERCFFWPPLYPLFVGAIYKAFGVDILYVRAAQCVLGAASCALSAMLAWGLFRHRGLALAAGAICAVAGPLIVFDGQLLSGSLDVLLQLGAVYLLLWAGEPGKGLWRWMLAGLCVGFGIINRGGLVFYLPLALVWVALSGRGHALQGGRRRLRRDLVAMAALLLPVVLLIAPVAWHNAKTDDDAAAARNARRIAAAEGGREAAAVANARGLENLRAGRFTLVGAVGGLNLRLGNHWRNRGLNDPNHPLCFVYYERLRGEPDEAGISSAAERSRFHRDKAMQQIADRPLDFARIMGLKLYQLVHGAEISRNFSIYAERDGSWVLKLLLWKWGLAFPSGLIIPFGLLGLFLARARWRRHFPVMALWVAQVAFISIFFVTSRYRLPCLPLLAIYASYAGLELARRFARGGIGALAAPLVWLFALLLISNWNVGSMLSHGAFEHVRLAKQLRARGELSAAERHLRRAVEISPAFAEGRANLTLLLLEVGDLDEGVERFLREYTAGRPNRALREQRIALLDLRLRDFEPQRAAAIYLRLFEAMPEDLLILRRLARALAEVLPDGEPRRLATRAAAQAERGNLAQARALVQRVLATTESGGRTPLRQQLDRHTADEPTREAKP